ncbi:MAG: hypothetical protein HY298_19760 [Verrucomicrobia bacterium]|nr:hypothetical protein [Verrucomicrobiota bacterium]
MERPNSVLKSLLAFVVSGLVYFAVSALGHTLPISFLTVVPDKEYVHVELMLNPFELNFFSELDRNRNGFLEPTELTSMEEKVAGKIVDCLKLRVKGRLVAAETSGVTADIDSHHLMLRAHYRVDARRSPLTVECNLVSITSGSHLTQVTYSSSDRRQFANLDQQTTSVTFAPATAANSLGLPPQQHTLALSATSSWLVAGALLAAIAVSFLFIPSRWFLHRAHK